MVIVFLLISLIISSIIVQLVRGIFMKIIGANVMFFNGMTQFVIIIILALLIFGKVFY